ncbi:MAG: hypothetical protein IKF36_05895 [Bacilli bacterium]|nr:hypothetical protein [Bacilli bacterium]
MNKILNDIMGFINENTTLLIIICVFLIFVLIGYLIDNSIKARKLAKIKSAGNDLTIEETGVPESVVEEEPKIELEPSVEVEPTPVEEPVTPVVPIEEPEEDINLEPDVVINSNEEVTSQVVEDTPSMDNAVEVPEINPLDDIKTVNFDEIELENAIEQEQSYDEPEVEVPFTDDISEPTSVSGNEMTIDPAINELLNRDFTAENPVEESPVDNPASRLDELLLNNKVEEPTPAPVEESKYKNSKSLAEILGSKKSSESNEPIVTRVDDNPELMNTVEFQHELDKILKKINEEEDKKVVNEVKENPELMNTIDFQNELDRILKKINEESIDSSEKNSTLDETTDFNNMF